MAFEVVVIVIILLYQPGLEDYDNCALPAATDGVIY